MAETGSAQQAYRWHPVCRSTRDCYQSQLYEELHPPCYICFPRSCRSLSTSKLAIARHAHGKLISHQVHALPVALFNPRALLNPQKLLPIALGTVRSASFLAGFVSSFWAGVCLTRSVLLARLLPFVSHDFWDGPYGCIMVGCLISGSSIWIEDGRRRGEIGLYVLPRAIRSCLPHRWLTSGGRGVQAAER